jgi:hypothetical protein
MRASPGDRSTGSPVSIASSITAAAAAASPGLMSSPPSGRTRGGSNSRRARARRLASPGGSSITRPARRKRTLVTTWTTICPKARVWASAPDEEGSGLRPGRGGCGRSSRGEREGRTPTPRRICAESRDAKPRDQVRRGRGADWSGQPAPPEREGKPDPAFVVRRVARNESCEPMRPGVSARVAPHGRRRSAPGWGLPSLSSTEDTGTASNLRLMTVTLSRRRRRRGLRPSRRSDPRPFLRAGA